MMKTMCNLLGEIAFWQRISISVSSLPLSVKMLPWYLNSVLFQLESTDVDFKDFWCSADSHHFCLFLSTCGMQIDEPVSVLK